VEDTVGVLMETVTIETSVRVADIPDEIRSEHLPNKILERYLYTSLLAGRDITSQTSEGMNSNF
jgi:hypothetical protein